MQVFFFFLTCGCGMAHYSLPSRSDVESRFPIACGQKTYALDEKANAYMLKQDP